jgi:hypothetical protein
MIFPEQAYNKWLHPNSASKQRSASRFFFPTDQRQLVRTLLFEQCGNNLPFLENHDEKRLERFQFAALKLSEGKLEELHGAIALAKADWRDLLVAAGFGDNANAHRAWLPEQTWR